MGFTDKVSGGAGWAAMYTSAVNDATVPSVGFLAPAELRRAMTTLHVCVEVNVWVVQHVPLRIAQVVVAVHVML